MKNILFYFLLIFPAGATLAQKADGLVNSKRFQFIANSITPLSSPTVLLTQPFNVVVKNDTLIASLPVQADPDKQVRIENTDKNFQAQVSSKKTRSGYDVTVSFLGATAPAQYSFEIARNGTATLRITGNGRPEVSYGGYIRGL